MKPGPFQVCMATALVILAAAAFVGAMFTGAWLMALAFCLLGGLSLAAAVAVAAE